MAGCDFPTGSVIPLASSDPALHVLMVLDPGRSSQLLVVESTDAGVELGEVDAILRNVAAAGPAEDLEVPGHRVDIGRCSEEYGIVAYAVEPRCIRFAMRPLAGGTYALSVSAPGRDTARARVTVPDDFRILAVDASGSPPGTDRLDGTWTRSVAAFRYFVFVRPEKPPTCQSVHGCEGGWYAAPFDTTISTSVPSDALEGGGAPWWFEVHAVDEALFEYLTTGSGGGLMPVPPVQNVEGGYGTLGARVQRKLKIE